MTAHEPVMITAMEAKEFRWPRVIRDHPCMARGRLLRRVLILAGAVRSRTRRGVLGGKRLSGRWCRKVESAGKGPCHR